MRGETLDGNGEVAGEYFRKGRKRWMYKRWLNILLQISIMLIISKQEDLKNLLHQKDIWQLAFFNLKLLR